MWVSQYLWLSLLLNLHFRGVLRRTEGDWCAKNGSECPPVPACTHLHPLTPLHAHPLTLLEGFWGWTESGWCVTYDVAVSATCTCLLVPTCTHLHLLPSLHPPCLLMPQTHLCPSHQVKLSLSYITQQPPFILPTTPPRVQGDEHTKIF